MSNLVPIEPATLGTAKIGSVAQERRLEGDPVLSTWALDEAHGGLVKSGIWEATPGANRSIKGTTFEFCHILSGVVEITEDGGAMRRYTAGDSFLMKPGFTGVWRTIETVRKIYVTVTPQ